MNYFRTALLLAALTGFFLVVGYLLGGQAGLVLALVVALGMNLFAYWNSDKMVLRMANAQEVGPTEAPELYGIVQGLAQTSRRSGFGIWLYTPGDKARWLGFFQSTDDQGRLVAQQELTGSVSTYREMLITRESSSKPTTPGPIYLRGRIEDA